MFRAHAVSENYYRPFERSFTRNENIEIVVALIAKFRGEHDRL
jgi:hypothetical protein